jgi:hypothetical protein
MAMTPSYVTRTWDYTLDFPCGQSLRFKWCLDGFFCQRQPHIVQFVLWYDINEISMENDAIILKKRNGTQAAFSMGPEFRSKQESLHAQLIRKWMGALVEASGVGGGGGSLRANHRGRTKDLLQWD